VAALVVAGTGMIFIGVALPDFGIQVLAGYLLASVALFLVAWSRVPKSFQSAPVESSAMGRALTGAG
jgi:hypothetical protein